MILENIRLKIKIKKNCKFIGRLILIKLSNKKQGDKFFITY